MGKEDLHKNHKVSSKHKKKKIRNISSSSSDSSSNSFSSIDEKLKRKLKKKLKKLKKKDKLKKKKKEKKELKKLMKSKLKEKISSNEKKNEAASTSSYDVDINLMEKSKSLVPMTKEEWEKQQNTFKRVFDEETGRMRLVKGTGEIVEECVSRERYLAINKEATKGDGEYFQRKLLQHIK